MIVQVVEAWLAAPLRRFLDDARVRSAVVMHASGQVLGQAGFTQSADVMSACALAAAIHASATELGRQLGGKPFADLHVSGRHREFFLGSVATRRGTLLVLSVFDDATSVGVVQVFFEELRARLVEATPADEARGPRLTADFEVELDRNFTALFGR